MASAAALSDAQIMAVVKAAGWSGQNAVIAAAIALAESGGRPGVTGARNSNGSVDRGLFQINSIHTQLLASGNVFDANANARMAFTIYKNAGNKFTPWSAYNNRSYARFLARAQAVSGTTVDVDSVAGDVAGTTGSGRAATTEEQSFADVVTNGRTWTRVGLIAAGSLLLILFAATVIKVPLNPASAVKRLVK